MFANLLLAAAKEAPLIDLDGTVLLQFGVFVTLAVVLYVLVFKPYLGLRDRRQQKTEGVRQRARQLEAEAGLLEAEQQQRLGAARSQAEAERGRLREEAAAVEHQLVATTRSEAEQALAAARTQIGKERERARAELAAAGPPMAQSVAERLLGRPL